MARKLRKFIRGSKYLITTKLNPELRFTSDVKEHIKKLIISAKQKFKINLNSVKINDTEFKFITQISRKREQSLSQVLQWLNTIIAIRVNKSLKRTGAVFKDRYKSICCDLLFHNKRLREIKKLLSKILIDRVTNVTGFTKSYIQLKNKYP